MFPYPLLLVGVLAQFASGQPSIFGDISHLQHSKLVQYPTQLTQNIVPKLIHSHNDYWRDVPLYTALSLGVSSVEADVWLTDSGQLLVGHETAALANDRTLDSLYIQPLVDLLGQMNPKNSFTVNQTTHNGVFDTSSGTPLQLLIDIKTDGKAAMPFVLRALEPLRSRGYLTTFKDGTLVTSAVTVIGTGNTPLDDVLSLNPRDCFFDAPLTGLTSNPSANTTWSPNIAPIASTDYNVAVGWSGINDITDTQLQSLEKLITDAHGLGIKARFWDTPGWPIFARTKIWQQLLQSGADWLNADDLEAASEF